MATPNMDLVKLTEPFVLNGVTATGKELGRGAYGRVIEVIRCGTNYAAKQIHSLLVDLPTIKDDFLRECCTLIKQMSAP